MNDERRGRMLAMGVFLLFPPIWLGWLRLDPGAEAPAFVALSALYVALALGLSWGRFWIRWLALGLSGGGAFLLMVLALEKGLWSEQRLLWASMVALHLWPLSLLWGEAMAKSFDGEGAWRHDLKLEESDAVSVERSIVAIGFALPLALHFVLTKLPVSRKPELGWSALILIVLGLWGLLRMKTWALSALSSAAILLAMLMLTAEVWLAASVASTALVIAVAPWLLPVARGAWATLRDD